MKIGLIGYEANIANRVGSNQYAFELIKEIYKQDLKNNFIVYLPSKPLADMPKIRENWQYRVVGPNKLWNIFGLPRALYGEKPKLDLVFNPGHYSPLFTPVPLVVSIMDLGYLRFPEQFTKLIYWKLKFWTRISVKRARHIFAISNSTKEDVIKTYGIASEKITVTYPGFEKTLKIPSKIEIEKVKRKYQINGDYILFLSTLKPNKNIEGLLEAYNKLDNNLKLVIAGRKGWMFESIFRKVKELDLESRVIFTDFVAGNDKLPLMSGAQLYILPSFWEGFGVPVVESMALGIPVVVSNAGSLPEVVGEAGIIVDPYDINSITEGMRKALKCREKLIKCGYEQAKKFTWADCARKTLATLEKII